MLKRIFVILAIIFVLIVAAVSIFIFTFDANRYKGLIIEKVSQALQKDINIDHISLDIVHGLGARIDGISIKDKDRPWGDALLKLASLEVSVKVLPLLKKDIQINRVELNGLDVKLTDELLKQPLYQAPSSQKSVDTGTAAVGALKFLAQAIIIKNSIITYVPKDAGEIKIGVSEAIFNNVSLTGPVRISAVVSTLDKGKDNIIIRGVVFPELSTKSPYIKDLNLKLDLAGIDPAGLLAAFGQAQAAQQLTGKRLRGIVAIRADKVFLDPNKIFDANVSLTLSEFETDIIPLEGGIKGVNLDASLADGDMHIRKLSGIIAGGAIIAQGTIKGLRDFGKNNKLPQVEDFKCQLNLADFDAPRLFKALGNDQLAQMAQGKTLQGNVAVKGDVLLLDPSELFNSEASVSVSKLTTDMVPVRGGVRDVEIEAHLQHGDLVIKKLSGLVAGGPISVSGTVKNIAALVSQKGALQTENVNAQLNLEDFNLPELFAMFGNKDLSEALKGKTIAGKVRVKSEKLFLNQKEKSTGLSILLSQGMTDIVPIQGGIKDVELEAGLEQNDMVVYKLTGSGAGGTFLVRGSVKDLFSAQRSNFDISCRGVNLETVFPQTKPDAPRFQGTLDLKAVVAGQGLQQAQLIKSLTGSGSCNINKPVLKNMNIVRMAFEKMDMIPGLVARLKENLPGNYYEVLKRNDTYFKPMDVKFTVSQGLLVFQDASVESDGFLVRSGGAVGLLGDVSIGGQVFIAPDLSQAFVGVVKELRFLANDEGMITIPVTITGKAPQVSVNIDRDYVIRKLLVSKGSELLENIFKKKGREGQPSQDTSQPSESQNSNTNEDKDNAPEPAALIKSIFDILGSENK